MEGTEKRIEQREAKPVWQEPSGAGSYNSVTQPAHYARFAIQPIEFILANGLNFLQASVIKYLVRYPYKNGMEDLLKCRNMLDRLIAEEQKKTEKVLGDLTSAAGKCADPFPDRGNYPTSDQYYIAVKDWYRDQPHAENLVRDAGQEVGSQPASENAEHRADRRDGSE